MTAPGLPRNAGSTGPFSAPARFDPEYAGPAGRPVAVVTGGTRGIGLGVARDLATTHHVVVGGRTTESVERGIAGLPSAEAFVADLADCAPGGSLDTALAALVPRLERVDVLVHSAGVATFGRIEEIGAESWHRALDVNVVAVSLVTRARHSGRVDTDMQHELVAFEGGVYEASAYLDVESVVRAVRLAVDAGPRATVSSITVRPRGYRA